MTDSEHADSLRRWLANDLFVLNTVFLVAASSLAIALTSCLWHHIHPELPSIDQQHPDDAPSFFAALSSFRVPTARTTSSASQQQSFSTPALEQKDHKSTRSKERRRRGKDPFRDLLRGGKKSKALLKAIKTVDNNHPRSTDTHSIPAVLGNDSASSTSRSQSPEPIKELDPCAPCSDADSVDGDAEGPTRNISPTLTHTSSGNITDYHSPDTCSLADTSHLYSVHSDSMTSADAQLNVSSPSTVTRSASEMAPSSPPVSTACTNICTRQLRSSQAVSVSDSSTKLVRARTRLRLSRMEPVVKSSLLSFTPTLPDSVASTSPSVRPGVPCPSVSLIPSTHSTDDAGPSTPTNSWVSTSPSRSLPPPEDDSRGERNISPSDQCVISAQIQLASLHSALEAARLREEQLRVEAEQVSKERDELRWRWSEDAVLWRRREAELQAHIHHLMQQLQAYVTVASFQVQHALNSVLPSPTSPHVHSSPHLHQHPFPLPPVIQTQNSASAPAHVQALLACAPMFTSHHPGFAAPVSAGLYSGTDHGISPLIWSGMGLCVPKRDSRHGGRWTPDSSASGSSSRGRQQEGRAENVRSASGESSLGDWEDGSGDEDPGDEDEDIFRNNALADAILKRPESIRELSGSVGKRSGTRRAPSSGQSLMHWVDEVGGRVGERMGVDLAGKHRSVPPLTDTLAVRTAADALDR